MCELNELMTRWRNSLSDLSESQVQELEDHLRAEIAQLRGHDLSEREVFTVATMRCGRPDEICDEFCRAGQSRVSWRKVMLWALGVVCGFPLYFVVPLITLQLVGMWIDSRGWSPRGLPDAVTVALVVLFYGGPLALWWFALNRVVQRESVVLRRWLPVSLAGPALVVCALALLGTVIMDWRWLTGSGEVWRMVPGILWWMVLPLTAVLLLRVVIDIELCRSKLRR